MIAEEMSRGAAGDRAAGNCASARPATTSAAGSRHSTAAPAEVKKVV
jgi:hypothetical protein